MSSANHKRKPSSHDKKFSNKSRDHHWRSDLLELGSQNSEPCLCYHHDCHSDLVLFPLWLSFQDLYASHQHFFYCDGHSACLADRARYFFSDEGFGLLFGYTKKLVWSGIGFNFFILAFCLEFYPLINDFWTRTGIQNLNNPQITFSSSKEYFLFLANRDMTPTA